MSRCCALAGNPYSTCTWQHCQPESSSSEINRRRSTIYHSTETTSGSIGGRPDPGPLGGLFRHGKNWSCQLETGTQSCLPSSSTHNPPNSWCFQHSLGSPSHWQKRPTTTDYTELPFSPLPGQSSAADDPLVATRKETEDPTPKKPGQTGPTVKDCNLESLPALTTEDPTRRLTVNLQTDLGPPFKVCPPHPDDSHWFTDADFCVALLKVSIDLLPLLCSSLNVNNSNADSKTLNCFSGVVNLSDHTLSDSELSLLSKGLTFVDTPPPPDLGLIMEDIQKFHISIKRHLAIGKLPSYTQDATERITSSTPFGNQKFRNPSKWNPPSPAIVEHMALLNESAILKSEPHKLTKRNLTSAEYKAKTSLTKNDSIVIKKADKGSAVVVQNKSDYISEGLRQLSDRNFYRLQEENLTNIHNSQIRTAVDGMVTTKEITLKTADYLVLDNPRTAKFYLLPKIHKNKFPPPGRPIVSANECPSERISQFVDHIIQPLVPLLPSYLRDSSHLLNLLRNIKIPDNSILATLDVTSLYTNIPNKEGIHAVSKYLFRHWNAFDNPTNASICNLLHLVLTANNFEFDNKEFLQVGGTAMGTKLAPSFANLSMGDFEDKFVYTYPKQPFIWKRFIDDIFLIWTYSEQELNDFIAHLNTSHDTIKFTAEISTISIDFLDITVKNTKGSLSTTLFCKPTDSHNYLLYSSEHPRHILNGIPYSQFLRIRRICSDISDFKRNAFMLSTHFIRRGYPKRLVLQAIDKCLI